MTLLYRVFAAVSLLMSPMMCSADTLVLIHPGLTRTFTGSILGSHCDFTGCLVFFRDSLGPFEQENDRIYSDTFDRPRWWWDIENDDGFYLTGASYCELIPQRSHSIVLDCAPDPRQ